MLAGRTTDSQNNLPTVDILEGEATSRWTQSSGRNKSFIGLTLCPEEDKTGCKIKPVFSRLNAFLECKLNASFNRTENVSEPHARKGMIIFLSHTNTE
jgi:hypothetical protein